MNNKKDKIKLIKYTNKEKVIITKNLERKKYINQLRYQFIDGVLKVNIN